MKTLKEKHLDAIETKDFWAHRVNNLIEKTKNDSSGACWQINEVEEYAKKQAVELDLLSNDEKAKKPLFGLSVGMKDLFCIQGVTTSAGSKMLETFKAPYDSQVWETLKSKGALLGAKLAMDEFAMGSYSNTSCFGKTNIPGFPEHTAGGSSGGSGAALVADLVDFTTGSDTGGSVRLPAAFCGKVGYKPSYGAFSRFGMIAYASSLDQAGFLTHTISDLVYLMDAGISVKDSRDMTCVGVENHYSPKSIKEMTVGYFPEFFEALGIQDSVKNEYRNMINNFKASGAKIKEVSLQDMKHAAQVYYILATSEASSNLARYQGVYTGHPLVNENFEGSFWEQAAQYRSKYFGKEVQKRIMIGSYILSAENYALMYEKAVSIRRRLTREIDSLLSEMDFLVLPTSPFVAPKWEDISKMTSAEIYMADYLTVPFSLAGVPVVSRQFGISVEEKLPIGFQFVGKKYNDYQLIKDVETVLG